MSKPESIKAEPWTGFQKQPYSFIHDDFPHEKLFTAKGTVKGAKSTFNIKQTLNKSEDAVKYALQTKLWFNLKEGRSIYSRIKDNYIKVHFDNGIKDINGRNWNFYGSYQANKQLGDVNIKLGARYISKNIIWDNRFRIHNFHKVEEKFQKDLTLYNKVSFTQDKLTFNLFGVVCLTQKLLVHNGFLASYKDGNNQFWLRLENKEWRSDNFDYKQLNNIFSKIFFNYVRSVNENQKCGLQVQFGVDNTKPKRITAAFQKKIPDENATLKMKFSSNLSFALAIQRSLGSYGTSRVGFEVNDLGRTNNFKFGAQVDLNL